LVMYSGVKNPRLNVRAAGAGILLLAIAALGIGRRRDVLVHLLLFVALVDCSIGPPLPLSRLIQGATAYEFIEPSRVFILACLPLSMLAALGVDGLTERPRRWIEQAVRTLLVAAGGTVVLMALAKWINPHPFLKVSEWTLYIPVATMAMAVLAAWTPFGGVSRLALVGLVLAEIAVWNHAYVPRLLSVRGYRPREASLAFWEDNQRGADPAPNLGLYELKPAMNGYDPLYIARVRQLLCAPGKEDRYWRELEDREVLELNHRGNLLFKRAFWLAREYVDGPLPDKGELFPSATTVFFDNPGDIPVPRVLRENLLKSAVSKRVKVKPLLAGKRLPRLLPGEARRRGGLTIKPGAIRGPKLHSALRIRYRSNCRAQVKPAFRSGGDGRFEKGCGDALRPTGQEEGMIEIPLPDYRPLWASVDIDPQHPAPDIEVVGVDLVSDLADECGLIKVIERTANKALVEVGALKEPRILTFLDAQYPGWLAFVDDKPVPILTADEAFKAVVVPPGTHRVRFVFRPVKLYMAAGISVVTLAGVLGVLVVGGIARIRPMIPIIPRIAVIRDSRWP